MCVAGAVIVCWLGGGLLVRILFGISDASDYLKQMVGLMALAMGFSSLLNVAVQFLVAQRRFRPAYAVIGLAVLYLGGVLAFHDSAWQIAILATVCNAAALGALLMLLWRNKWFAADVPA
jgi:hypothetical protein